MEKQVTSNITQLSLAESLEKWLGRQMLASFSLIRSSILVMKELHLRRTGVTLGPFLFLGLLKYHILNFHEEEQPLIFWKSVYRFPETHQEVVCRVPVLTSVAHWLHQIKYLPFISIIASSNGRFPLLSFVLRWADDRDVSDGAGVCIELSAEDHSATKSSSILVQLSFSGSVDSRSSCLDCNCMLLSIFLAFEVLLKKSNILNHLCWDSLFLGDKPGYPDLFAFILLSSAQKLFLSRFHLFFTFLPVK